MHRSLFAALAALSMLAPAGAFAQDGDDVGAATEAICCGAGCCAIPVGDGCQTRGETNPDNPCEECNPSMSQSAFSPIAGCGTDAGPTPAEDAGTTPPPMADAGTGTTDDGGCAVRPGVESHAGLAFGLVALGALFLRRRR